MEILENLVIQQFSKISKFSIFIYLKEMSC